MSKAIVNIKGVVGVDITLKTVISAFKSFDNPTEAEFIIESNGGYVEEGKAIYSFIKNLDIPTTTIGVKAYSIAATILMAGDTRLVDDVGLPVMFHLPLAQNVTGTSDYFTAVAKQLKVYEEYFVGFYVDVLGVSSETAESLLRDETYLTPQEAVDMGVATGIRETLKAVALFTVKNDSFMSKTQKLFQAIAEKLGIALEVSDANSDPVDFYELEEGAEPAKGDKARVDGKDAEGEIVMPDGRTFVFSAGEVTEIKEAEIEEEAPAEEEVTAEVIEEISKWEIEVNETSFEVGTQLTYSFGDDTYNMGAGEFQTKTGERVVTDASGIVVTIKPAEGGEAEEAPAEEEAAEEVEAVGSEELTDKQLQVVAALNAKNEELEAKVLALQSSMVSPDFSEEAATKVKVSAEEIEKMTPLQKRRYFKSL